MTRSRKKRTVWNARIERNIVKDYASRLALTGMDVLNIASYFGRTVEETETMIDKLRKR